MFKKYFLAVLLLFAISSIYSKSGPQIPEPEISIEEAIKIAKKIILEEEKAVDTDWYPLDEYIIISVRYTKNFNGEVYDERSWFISFVHPVANDHNIFYRIVDSKKFELVGLTE